MGLETIYAKPRSSVPGTLQQRYPYLLRGMSSERCNQVWSCDITYIRLVRGFIYLMAVIDWFSRYVLSWEISITLDTSFCLQALDRALAIATPEIFNTEEAGAVHQCRVYQPAEAPPIFASAGMAQDEPSTTFVWNDYGAVSNTRRSTSKITKA
jgi:hypothetical protein